MSKIVIGRQFCGPPNSGNGGYVCGVLADGLEGPVTAVLRAPSIVGFGKSFQLDGSASFDVGGGKISRYVWTYLGPAVL